MLGSTMPLDRSLAAFQHFCGSDLTTTLARIESSIRGVSAERLSDALSTFGASNETLSSAGHFKRLMGQLNVVIHALGILSCLPHILDVGETIESVSLGA